MRKFHDVYKEKQNRAVELFESKVLGDFKYVYGTLLDKYSITDFYNLNEEEQVTFLAELNSYWSEEEGISERGQKFVRTRSDVLSESSTTLQKKNFLKNRASVIISESLRQAGVKWQIYDVIDEMYKEVEAGGLTDVLSPDLITDIIKESFVSSLNSFMKEMRYELNESAKEVDLNEEKKNPDAKVRNRGNVVFPAGSKKVKDDKDHFPINNKAQARNALARANQYKKSPSWYAGSLDELVKRVASAVKGKYKGIQVSEDSEKPGKK